jgi:hypothetical protein
MHFKEVASKEGKFNRWPRAWVVWGRGSERHSLVCHAFLDSWRNSTQTPAVELFWLVFIRCPVRMLVGTPTALTEGFMVFLSPYTKFIILASSWPTTPICLFMALRPVVGPSPLFEFLDLFTAGRTTRTGDQPVARLLPAHRRAQTQNKRTHTYVPQLGFEPPISAFERTRPLWSAVH